jgi:hypothetical protein
MKCPGPFPAATEFTDELGGRRMSHHCKLADILAACETFVHAAETKALRVVIER